jgi:hypothetical protein
MFKCTFAQEIGKKLTDGRWHIKKFDIGSDKNSFKENTKEYYWFKFNENESYSSKFLLEERNGSYTFNEETKTIIIDFENLKGIPLTLSENEDGNLELNGKLGRKKILIVLYQ